VQRGGGGDPPALSQVFIALLGIAQRQIRIKFSQKTRKPKNYKPLPESIKSLGDWIQVKRREKNLTPGHLAAKMGIATSLVLSWEDGKSQPDRQQMKALESLFGYNADFDPTKKDLFP
jgi:ribosome-binding protein aMBF1 (putative translation factor)